MSFVIVSYFHNIQKLKFQEINTFLNKPNWVEITTSNHFISVLSTRVCERDNDMTDRAFVLIDLKLQNPTSISFFITMYHIHKVL